jgi:hypothetical protein
MDLSVTSPDNIVGKKDVALTVKFKVGSFFPLVGRITLKFPPYYTYDRAYYSNLKTLFSTEGYLTITKL